MKLTRLDVLILITIFVICLGLLVQLNHVLAEDRAMECSTMLHGYSRGTLVPLTNASSVEIGACLLQFNQPLTTGEEG